MTPADQPTSDEEKWEKEIELLAGLSEYDLDTLAKCGGYGNSAEDLMDRPLLEWDDEPS